MNSGQRTDVLLWRAKFAADAPAPRKIVLSGELSASRVAWSTADSLLYVYAALARQAHLSAADAVAFESILRVDGQAPASTQVCRLESILDRPGASALEAATHHYVVETDAEDGWMDEIARWYEMEHLPGLAAVPGCIRARRFVNHDEGPCSLACYDLTSADVLQSPAWLSVRATRWSDRTRPRFTNTRRTMFQVISGDNP